MKIIIFINVPDLPKRICRRVGCQELVTRGYCPKHINLISKKFQQSHLSKHASFYATRTWAETSRQHRAAEPLCRRCKAEGIIRVAKLVHHHPPLEMLLQKRLNPYDDRYLESLCMACHNKELTLKQLTLKQLTNDNY
jgi:5-methylcytosine-specific restriction enzyme A